MEFITVLMDKIRDKINSINTSELAIVTAVYPEEMRCDIKLKSMINHKIFELKKVPIAFTHFAGSTIIMLPEVNDVVILSFTRRSLKDQIVERGILEILNDGILYEINNAVVTGSLYANDEEIPLTVPKQILIRHSTGTTLRIKPDGTIELVNHDAATGIKIENGTLSICANSEIRIEAPQVSIYTHKMPIDFYKSNTDFEPVRNV